MKQLNYLSTELWGLRVNFQRPRVQKKEEKTMYEDLVVIVKKGTKNVSEHVDKVLEPYNVSVVVPPFARICACIGIKAMNEGLAAAEKEIGMTYSALRKEYESQPESDRPGWCEYAFDFELARAVHATRVMDSSKADPSCVFCGGTGISISTANPKGFWDWYNQEGLFKDLGTDTVGKWMELLQSSNKYLLPHFLISMDNNLYSSGNLYDLTWESPFPKSIYRWRKIVLDVLGKSNSEDIVVGLNIHV